MMSPHEALLHAIQAHDGEYDKCGLPAIMHPVTVAHKLRSFAPDIQVVAFLHDVLEDTCYPRARLANLSVTQWYALECMTHNRGEDYADYIERVCKNSLSCYVKLADLHTNLNRGPIPNELAVRAIGREQKYLSARNRIWIALGSEWWPSDADA